jgi:hypothetical protein
LPWAFQSFPKEKEDLCELRAKSQKSQKPALKEAKIQRPKE